MIIHEYQLSWSTTLQLPKYAKVLSVQIQNAIPTIWVAVNDEFITRESRKFIIVPTGEPYDERDKTYIGTVQDGALVWHLFEVALE